MALTLVMVSPMESVKNTVSELKRIVSDPGLKSKKEAKKEHIRAVILEKMDLEEMGRRALGRNWRGRTEAERKEYLEVFTQYIEVFYRKQVFESVEFINSVDIKYLKERVDGEFAEVDVEVVPKQGDSVKLTFRLHIKDGQWKAYDVVVENISQVGNLRAQFDRIIEKEKFAGFLKRLREKIQELDR